MISDLLDILKRTDWVLACIPPEVRNDLIKLGYDPLDCRVELYDVRKFLNGLQLLTSGEAPSLPEPPRPLKPRIPRSEVLDTLYDKLKQGPIRTGVLERILQNKYHKYFDVGRLLKSDGRFVKVSRGLWGLR